jgi:hypothetical protein
MENSDLEAADRAIPYVTTIDNESFPIPPLLRGRKAHPRHLAAAPRSGDRDSIVLVSEMFTLYTPLT